MEGACPLRRFSAEEVEPLHCLALGGHLLVAGGPGKVLFWDRRSGQQCGCFDDTHADDVTQVHLQLLAAQLQEPRPGHTDAEALAARAWQVRPCRHGGVVRLTALPAHTQ